MIYKPETRYLPMKDDPERMEKVKKYTRQFLGAGTGGPETYEGLDMPAAQDIINHSRFCALITLDKSGHPQTRTMELFPLRRILSSGLEQNIITNCNGMTLQQDGQLLTKAPLMVHQKESVLT